MKVNRLPTGRWQLRWYDKDGKQRSRNYMTRPSPEEITDAVTTTAPADETTFGDFAKKWLADYAPATRSASTRYEDAILLRRHILPGLGHLPLHGLKKAQLIDFRSALLQKIARAGKPLAAKTINTIVQVAKQIVLTAVDLELIEASPWQTVKPLKKQMQAQARWTKAERERFLTYCRREDPAFAELVLVAVHTGLRKGELEALQVQQLDFDERTIRVDATYNRKLKERLPRSKNGEIGRVHMTEEVYEALKTRLPARGSTAPVFDPHLFADCYDRLKARCKAAKVRSLRFHDLRHSFASILADMDVSSFKVKELMRHKTMAMTEHYAKPSKQSLRDAMKKVSASSLDSDPDEADNQAINQA